MVQEKSKRNNARKKIRLRPIAIIVATPLEKLSEETSTECAKEKFYIKIASKLKITLRKMLKHNS